MSFSRYTDGYTGKRTWHIWLGTIEIRVVFNLTTQDAFELGRLADSILDNPFWKNYPKEWDSAEADFGRSFVDGYVSKLVEERENSSHR